MIGIPAYFQRIQGRLIATFAVVILGTIVIWWLGVITMGAFADTVAGRVANFGRGVMEDVSRRLVGQMADCIKADLEEAQQAPAEPAPAAGATGTAPAAPGAGAGVSTQARPVNAVSLVLFIPSAFIMLKPIF